GRGEESRDAGPVRGCRGAAGVAAARRSTGKNAGDRPGGAGPGVIMLRREFLKLIATGVAAAGLEPAALFAQPARSSADEIEGYFIQILRGFLKNAGATSKDF